MGGFIDNEWVGGPLEYMLPHAHAAVYESLDRVELVACCDPRTDVLARFGERYGVPPEKRYTDYREMLTREELDIVSIATQPEQRAEIALFACERGVRALFCEKAFAASLEEADRVAQAVKARNIAFAMGTSRRWDVGYEQMKALIHSGELGELKSIVIYGTGTLYNSASHWFDLALWLNNDAPVAWVQANLPGGDGAIDGEVLRRDPVGEGLFRFADGVTVYALQTPRGPEIEAICSKGTVAALNNARDWLVRRMAGETWRALEPAPFPDYVRQSPNRRLVEELIAALDTGAPTRGGVDVAVANQELIAAFIESHRRGGARVELPLPPAQRRVRLESGVGGRQPKYVS